MLDMLFGYSVSKVKLWRSIHNKGERFEDSTLVEMGGVIYKDKEKLWVPFSWPKPPLGTSNSFYRVFRVS